MRKVVLALAAAGTLIAGGIATLILSTIIIGFGTWLKGYPATH